MILPRSYKSDLTLVKPSTQKMDTEYGEIAYIDWCTREKQRIKLHKYYVREIKKDGIDYCCIGSRRQAKRN